MHQLERGDSLSAESSSAAASPRSVKLSRDDTQYHVMMTMSMMSPSASALSVSRTPSFSSSGSSSVQRVSSCPPDSGSSSGQHGSSCLLDSGSSSGQRGSSCPLDSGSSSGQRGSSCPLWTAGHRLSAPGNTIRHVLCTAEKLSNASDFLR